MSFDDNMDHSRKKRTRDDGDHDTDTSEDEQRHEVIMARHAQDDCIFMPLPKTRRATATTRLSADRKGDSSLDLGDDKADYKTSTMSKHHPRSVQDMFTARRPCSVGGRVIAVRSSDVFIPL